MEIKFKPDVEERLQKLGIREQLVEAIYDTQSIRNLNIPGIEREIERIESTTSFSEVIICSFDWKSSKEGIQYWADIRRQAMKEGL